MFSESVRAVPPTWTHLHLFSSLKNTFVSFSVFIESPPHWLYRYFSYLWFPAPCFSLLSDSPLLLSCAVCSERPPILTPPLILHRHPHVSSSILSENNAQEVWRRQPQRLQWLQKKKKKKRVESSGLDHIMKVKSSLWNMWCCEFWLFLLECNHSKANGPYTAHNRMCCNYMHLISMVTGC